MIGLIHNQWASAGVATLARAWWLALIRKPERAARLRYPLALVAGAARLRVPLALVAGAARLRVPLAWAVFAFCVGASQPAQAQLKLDRLFPPAVAAGSESEISAEGKFPNWPVEVDCDRADVEILPGKDSGKFAIKIPENSPPGVAWVRFYDDQSASQLQPLIIAPLSVTTETEPNDNRDAAQSVSMPAVITGRLAKGGDSDAYRVSLKAGQQLVASVTANQLLASPMDAVLQLTDLRGNVLAQVDDVRGLDPQLVYRSESDQDALVRIFAFPETPNSTIGFSGSSSYVYVCELTTGPFLDHLVVSGASPLAFGYNLPEPCTVDVLPATRIAPAGGSIPGGLGWAWDLRPADTDVQLHHGDEFDGTLPAVLTGHITGPKQSHTVSFAGVKGTKYRAEVRSKADGYLLDAKLTVTDQKSGSVLASNDDISRDNVDAGVDFTAKEDGIVDVTVSDMIDGFGPRHFYQLTIRESRPECRLTLADDHFVLPRDKPLEIPVTIERSSGFGDKLQITASGLPPGVVVENVISEPKGDTSKSVKLKLTVGEGAAGHATFQIIGTSLDSDGKPTDRTVTATFPLRPSLSPSEFWLTIPPAPADGKSSN